MKSPIAASLALLLLAGCETLPGEPVTLTGEFGGPHVGLVLQGGLGDLEYDCASGTIDQAVIPAKDGSFRVTGTHRAGQGGPVRVGQIFRSQRATYAGSVDKDKNNMTLTVTLEDRTVLGPFNLVRGAVPQITRCL
jgi:hypothetical protein